MLKILMPPHALKYLKVFFILFSTALLSACGGASSSNVLSLLESLDDLSLPQLVDDISLPELGDDSPLPPTIIAGNGSITTYIDYLVTNTDSTTSTLAAINADAVNRYYSQSYDNSSKVNDANENFMIFVGADDGVLDGNFGRPSYYWEIVNGSNANESPIFYEYYLAPYGAKATVGYVEDYGDEKLASGTTAITVALNATTNITTNIVIGGADNEEIRFSGLTITVDRDDYSYDVWKSSDTCSVQYCQVSVANVADYAHFIKAEYAAIYFFHYDSYQVRTNGDALRGGRHYGVLTKYENIPTTGDMTYDIDSIGSHTDYIDHSNDRILWGTGSVFANFEGGKFTLNLNVNDHNGDHFLDITDVGLELSPDRNQINLDYCGAADSGKPSRCAGKVEYNIANTGFDPDVANISDFSIFNPEDVGLSIGASFYGPNGEEIAGGVSDTNSNVELVFIGKQQ